MARHDELESVISMEINKIAKRSCSLDDVLADNGFNSMLLIAAIFCIEKTMEGNFDIQNIDFSSLITVNDLQSALLSNFIEK